MSRRHIPESHTAHPNVTPLIDIIMCLIVFFMLVAKIGVTTGAEKVEIPVSIQGTKITDMNNTLTLNIPDRLDNDYPVISAFIKAPGATAAAMTSLKIQDSTGQNTLLTTLKYYHEQNPEFRVIIRAKADLDWRFIEPVLSTCNLAGVRSINYNTKVGKEE